jgi:hypothetical protein
MVLGISDVKTNQHENKALGSDATRKHAGFFEQ